MPLDPSAHPLHAILHPRSVVVVGASNNPFKMGTIQAMNLLKGGFKGEVVFLHPSEPEVLGKPTYKEPSELPFVPELALLVTPTQVTASILDGLGARGVRHAVVTTAGFAEMGDDGRARQDELLAVAQRHGIRFVGPNCIGILNNHYGLNTTVLPTIMKPGPLGVASQSGTFVAQLPMLMKERGLRYGKAVSVGNAIDIDLVDVIEYMGLDPEIRAIAVYIEGLSRGRRFMEVCRRVSQTKPIVALYVGATRAGARAGHSHTAALGGPDVLYDGVFRQAGVLRASTVDELFSWAWAAATQPLPKGPRMAVVTHSGGPATCMADEVERVGLRLPVFSDELQAELRAQTVPTAAVHNPVDMTFDLDNDLLARRLPEIVLGSDEIDGLLMHGLMDTAYVKVLGPVIRDVLGLTDETPFDQFETDMGPLLQLLAERGKPLVASTFAWDDHATDMLKAGGVPLLPDPQTAVRAMGALRRAAMVQERPAQAPRLVWEPVVLPELDAVLATRGKGTLDEPTSKTILSRYGVPLLHETGVRTLDETRAAASRMGYPVVLKGVLPGVAHKTEAGLVHLDLQDEASLDVAWCELQETSAGMGVLVAPMVRGRRELVVGATHFEGFGAATALGLGGLFAESLADVSFRVGGLTRADVDDMLDSLRAKKIFGATRGLSPIDREALASIVIGVSRLAHDHPEIREIDLNPVLVTDDGRPIVLDAMMVVG